MESPELSNCLREDPDDLQKRLIMLQRMEIHFPPPGADRTLANMEARYILLDEPDRYPLEDNEEGVRPLSGPKPGPPPTGMRKIIEPCTPTSPRLCETLIN